MPLVEKRYAEALVKISVEKNLIEQHQQELGLVAEMYGGSEDLKNFLLNPRNDRDTKKAFLRNVFSGRIQDEILGLLLLLLDKGRIKYLKGIYEEYVKLADEKRNVLSMSIITAEPLDAGQVKSISENFRKLYSASSVKSEVVVDGSLIGGIKVKIGDKLLDGSIKGRLKDLQEILLK
jgi:F-type H+-transporting ATPase subunit delta